MISTVVLPVLLLMTTSHSAQAIKPLGKASLLNFDKLNTHKSSKQIFRNEILFAESMAVLRSCSSPLSLVDAQVSFGRMKHTNICSPHHKSATTNKRNARAFTIRERLVVFLAVFLVQPADLPPVAKFINERLSIPLPT